MKNLEFQQQREGLLTVLLTANVVTEELLNQTMKSTPLWMNFVWVRGRENDQSLWTGPDDESFTQLISNFDLEIAVPLRPKFSFIITSLIFD